MSVRGELLDRFGLDEDDLAHAVREAIGGLPAPGSAALTDSERRALTEGGLDFDDQAASAGRAAHVQTLTEQVALLAGPDTAQLARALGVSESRIRHRVAAGALLAVRVGRGLRFPAFQLDSSLRPLPGLPAVLAAAPSTWPPAQLAAFMTTPQPELTMGDDRPVAPSTWLSAGGDPSAVTDLLGPDWT